MLRYSLAVLAFVIAAAIAFFDPRPLIRGSTTLPQHKKVAEITKAQGSVTVQTPRRFEVRPITGVDSLNAQEILSTGPDSETSLEFPGGWHLQVKENARIAADFEVGSQNRILVTVLRGEITTEQAGEPDRLLVFKDGKPVSPKGSSHTSPVITVAPRPTTTPTAVTEEEPAIAATLPDEPVATPQPRLPIVLPKKKPSLTKGLSDSEISQTLASQVGFFRRCFLGYMNRAGDKQANGTIFVAFEIATNGKVERTKLVDSPFEDTTLHTCLLEVISRTNFRNFDGSPIKIARFPISIE